MASAGRPFTVELLRELCALPGIGGQETAVTAAVTDYLAKIGVATQDAIGNTSVTAGGSGPPHVALLAHADQIGFIVTDVDDGGFLLFERVGEAYGDLLPGRELVVHTSAGPLHGVVGRAPRDLVPEDRRGEIADVRDHFLDIGASSREEGLAAVRIGDPITFVPRFLQLRNGLLASPALDDRAGLYVILRAFEEWVTKEAQAQTHAGNLRLTSVATAREETGFLGARALAASLGCDVAIIVDVIFASDDPSVSSRRAGGRVELGKGPVIARGTASAPHLVRLAEEVAERGGIPYQLRAAAGLAETDADDMLAATGCAVLSVSIPLRYMHSAMEVGSEADLDACRTLLVEVLKALDSDRG